MSYRVKLEIFEGPLDLLLYLIKKEELDICSISITRITDEYLEYINLMQILDLDVASEFLVVAATLMQIKSRMLLPEEELGEEEQEEDSSEALVRQLLEYKKYKEAAGNLGQMELEQHDVFTRPGGVEVSDGENEVLLDVSLFDLLGAFSDVLGRLKEEPITEIVKDKTTVREKIRFIMDILRGEKPVEFSRLFAKVSSKVEAIVTFLALLELIKLQEVRVVKKGSERHVISCMGGIYDVRAGSMNRTPTSLP